MFQGGSTAGIGRTLHLSPYTVQDHFETVVVKAGVSSRRELVSGVSMDHSAPRLGVPWGRPAGSRKRPRISRFG
ncbi:LuxR C-terminal-related transcriptional regulator [Rhodococcus tukisamuensis]|uniref:HTH luxR-type domain-containing protein n=1 Tax=Rhodococcus tukisamuensis TaxID=168276 RepID=A0A1G7E3I4_9NOCA|nr:hypothetical protein SAMN05444580_12224 [Rhodococcus tukisamuensis]